MSALVNDIVGELAFDDVSMTSGDRVLLGDNCVVKKSSSSSSPFIRTLGSYSVVSTEKSPEPEPLPTSISSGKKKLIIYFCCVFFEFDTAELGCERLSIFSDGKN